MKKYEVIVVGGGTGGLRCSLIAAKSGFNTALVEPGAIGGTCLNTGCIPTKTLVHAADVYTSMKNCKELGLKAGKVSFNFTKLMGRMHEIVGTGRAHATSSVKKMEGLTLYPHKAEFINKNTIRVGHEEIQGNKFIIATGSYGWIPPIPGLEKTKYLTNEEALQLTRLPKSMLFIGGGYISMEFACFFAAMGTKVVILERGPNILGMLDEDVSRYLKDYLEDHKIKIFNSIDILEVKGKNGRKVSVKTKALNDEHAKEKVFKAESLFISAGRRPNTQNMGLDKAGVNLTDRGHIKVDKYLQTSNKNVYALGDVHGLAPFAHTAKREAKIILDNALNDKKHELKHNLIPWAVFTTPVIGGVGLSEKQARKTKHKVGIMKGMFGKTGKAKIIQEPIGFVKLIYDKKTRKLLGAVIIGPQADNLIHEFALLLQIPNPKIDYVLNTVHVHPTLAEVMEELREI